MPSETRMASDVVAIVPAAGRATRLGRLPCSKELLPVGWSEAEAGAGPRPRPAAQHLLESLRDAGISRALFVLRTGKWDLPAYFQDGSWLGLRLAYLALPESSSSVESICSALPFAAGCRIALGFPDVLFEPTAAFRRVVERQEATAADVVLGLFPTDHPNRADMVQTDADGRVLRIRVKPRATDLRLSWMVAVWTPKFSRFLEEWLQRHQRGAGGRQRSQEEAARGEAYPGHAVQAAVDAGMRVDSVAFPDGYSLDIGTGEDLLRAVRRTLPME